MLTFRLPWLPALWCLHADGRAKADTQSACALTYNGCLQLHKSTVGLQSTQTGYTENSHPPTTAQALKSTKINLKEKEALQGRDLVRQSIITSHLMSPNSKCVFQSYERKGSQQTTQHRGKLGTLENNQKCPPDFMVFWTSTDLPMKLTVTGLLLLLNKIWRLWTWRQDGRAFYAETNDCSKIIYAVKKPMLLVSEKKSEDLLWDYET